LNTFYTDLNIVTYIVLTLAINHYTAKLISWTCPGLWILITLLALRLLTSTDFIHVTSADQSQLVHSCIRFGHLLFSLNMMNMNGVVKIERFSMIRFSSYRDFSMEVSKIFVILQDFCNIYYVQAILTLIWWQRKVKIIYYC
jgi:hypothetical protein